LHFFAVVGANAIRSGRIAYNEGITATNSAWLVMVVVNDHYQQNSALPFDASVTADVRVTTSAGIPAGSGDQDDYTGNLVPFTAGVICKENPPSAMCRWKGLHT
jgi:hypothetical protein